MRVITGIILSLLCLTAAAQKKSAYVSGKVIDENENPISAVSVSVLGKASGIVSNDSGSFRIKVVAEKSFALLFSHTGYAEKQQGFFLSDKEEEKVTIKLQRSGKTLTTVVVGDQRERTELGLTKINPKSALAIPAPGGGIEKLIQSLVGSNNELQARASALRGNRWSGHHGRARPRVVAQTSLSARLRLGHAGRFFGTRRAAGRSVAARTARQSGLWTTRGTVTESLGERFPMRMARRPGRRSPALENHR